jgi:N-methylhydantoinase A
LAVDWRTDHMVTKVMHEEAFDLAAVAAIYAALEAEGTATLEKDGIPPARIALIREADVRYAGQSMEVRVPAPAGQIDAQFVAGLADAFHAAHLKTFGYNYAGQQKVEVVNFCVSAFGMIDRPSIPELAKSAAPPRPASRQVYFDGAFRDTPVFPRASLPAGFTLEGSAIVEEFGSTSVVFPGQKLTVDPHGILIIRAAGK